MFAFPIRLLLPILCGLGITIVSGEERPPSSAKSASAPTSLSVSERDLKTLTVKLTNGEPVGLVADVVFGAQSGQPEFVVLQLFDNVGAGSHYTAVPTTTVRRPDAAFTAVPWKAFHYQPGEPILQLSATKEQLRHAPKLAAAAPDASPGASWRKAAQEHFASNDARGADGARADAVQGAGGWTEGPPRGSGHLGVRSRSASTALYVVGALIVGLLAGRYLLYRRT